MSHPPFPTGLTASLQDVWYEDEFIIALSNIKARKKQSGGSIETLLAVKYGESRTKMVLILDRRTKRGEPILSSSRDLSLNSKLFARYHVNVIRRSSYIGEPRRGRST